MAEVHTLSTHEPSAIDTVAVQALKQKLGEKRCRSVVDSVIFEITDMLCHVERRVAERSLSDLPQKLDHLRSMCGQVGLVCMIDIASDLKECIERDDRIAAAAVTARLIRVGEDSLYSLIEFTDRSIL